MGVGDYVHSKENRPRANDQRPQSRQAIAEAARVEVPETTLIAPVPISANGWAPLDRYGSPFRDQEPAKGPVPVHRDAFDTDVEGIDESTIAATSVIGVDEVPLQYRLSPAIHAIANANANANASTQQQQPSQASPSPSPSPQRRLRMGHRTNDSKWYEGLGDRALKSAGFDLDELDNVSQLTSTAGDDEQSNNTEDQRFISRYRTGEEPLSRRLQNFWSASRRTYQPDTTLSGADAEPLKSQSYIPIASAPKQLSANARKVTLQRSMTATPRTRFSPPKPSLLEQLDLTPTRRSPGLTRTHSRKERGGEREREKERGRERERQNEVNNTTDDFLKDTDQQGLGLSMGSRHLDDLHSLKSLNVFDMTNFDDLENDSSMNDPFSRRTSMRRVGKEAELDTLQPQSNTTTTTTATQDKTNKRRHLDLKPDYPPEILATKSFTDLQAEPFDHAPTPRKTSKTAKPAKAGRTNTEDPPEQSDEEDKISFLLRLSESERASYFTSLSMDEWEDCGDALIDEFSRVMVKMKDLRHARRRTAAVFEAEIKRRHEVVEEQNREITGKFDEMRAGGAEVLRGRSP